MNIILTTERLILKTIDEADAQHMYELNFDPEVIRYTGDVGFNSIEEAHAFIQSYTDYEKNGYGRWTALLRSTGEYIGWCGLKYNKDRGETDLGYRLMKKYWNQGYATEASKACLDYGFSELGLKRIIACAAPANKASIRVMEKLGMQFEKMIGEEGEEWVQYVMVNG